MNFAKNLKQVRKENNLSQEQLAEKLGVSRQSVSKWESGAAYPEMDKVIQLCKLFDLSIDELMKDNIKEVKNDKEVKKEFNNIINEFLNYITKTVDLFSSLKFKGKIKFLFEQFIIFIALTIIFSIGGLLLSLVYDSFMNIFSFGRFNDTLYRLFRAVYTTASVVFGLIIMLHIFKVRYLDYFNIVDKPLENKEVINEEKEVKNIERKEDKIIIRDTNNSAFSFFKFLFKTFTFFWKIFLGTVLIGFIFTIIFLVISFVLAFYFKGATLFFAGIQISIVSATIICIIISIWIIHYILNIKNNRKLYIMLIASFLVAFSLGLGVFFYSLPNFKHVKINQSDDKKIVKLPMEDNLLINMDNIKFIEKDIKDVEFEINKYDRLYSYILYSMNYKEVYIIDDSDEKFIYLFKKQIKYINNYEIITDYTNDVIKIYASKENIEKLHLNIINYNKEIEQN